MRLNCSRSNEISIDELRCRINALAAESPELVLHREPQLAGQELTGNSCLLGEQFTPAHWKRVLQEFFYSKLVGNHKELKNIFLPFAESSSEKVFVGSYAIKSVLGIGSDSCVYRTSGGKCLKVSGAAKREKLEHEYKILRQLKHRNIVTCFDFICGQDYGAIVLEALSAGSGERADYICGLNYCHRRGILHGDIRLSNLGVDSAGNGKIFDFGNACTSVSKVESFREMKLLNNVLASPLAEARKITRYLGEVL